MKKKASSTNQLNDTDIQNKCNIAFTLGFINGRWKPTILWLLLKHDVLRYNELKKLMPGIAERMLSAQLKELEQDALILRLAYPEVPPRVEYRLSPQGMSLTPVLKMLEQWGENHKLIQ